MAWFWTSPCGLVTSTLPVHFPVTSAAHAHAAAASRQIKVRMSHDTQIRPIGFHPALQVPPASVHVLLGLFPVLDNVARLKKNILQDRAPVGLLSQQELEIHAEVLELLLLRVLHDGSGGLVLLNRNALLIPVNGLGLFDHRNN